MSAANAVTSPAILWTPEPEFDEDDPTYLFKHESGRTFYLNAFERWDARSGTHEVFFVYEDVPSDRLLVCNAHGHVIDHHESETLKVLLQNPNRFFPSLAGHGIDMERLMPNGAGMGLGSITYTSREAANQAVWKALQDNVWYRHHSPALAKQISASEASQAAQRKASQDYCQAMIAQLETALAQSTSLLKGTGAWIPGIGSNETIRQRLLAFRNAPSIDTWSELARCMILPDSTTAWQVWTEYETNAPRSLGEEGFTEYPDPNEFFENISRSAEASLTFYRNKLAGHQKD